MGDDNLISNFNSHQYHILDNFYKDILQHGNKLERIHALRFSNILTKSKPAFEFTTLQKPLKKDGKFMIYKSILEIINKLNLPYHRKERDLMGKKVITHICGCKRPFKIPSYSKQNMKKYHSEWGKLYGYPHSAIQAFIQNNTLRYDKYKRDAEQLLVYLQEIEDSNFNLNYLQLISFLPANSTNGIQDAIDISYKYKKLLYEMSHNYELPHFSKLLQFQIETEKPSQLYLTN